MQRHPESHLVATCQRLDDESAQIQIAAHDIVIDCSDNLATRQQLNRLCYSGQTPLVSGAAIRMEGQLFCVEPAKQSACYECFSQFFQEQSLSCHEAGVLSPIVGIIGNLQALEVIKIVTQYGESLNNTLILFDGMRGEWQKLKVKKSTACQVCNA